MAPHPLPARPSVGQPPRNGVASSPGLALPRAQYYSSPQPASPRSAAPPQQYPTASPKIGPTSVQAATAEEASWTRRALTADQMRANSDQVEIGEGWTVRWSCWRGTPLMASSRIGEDANLASTSTNTLSLSTPVPSSSTGASYQGGVDQPRAKRARLDEDDAVPLASTSSGSTLKKSLRALEALNNPSLDSIEVARRQIVRIAKASGGTELLGLFAHVDVSPAKVEDRKGKGKQVETERDLEVSRTLWVFSLVQGGDATEDPAATAFAALEFANLTRSDQGQFTHCDLYPSLYPVVAPTSESPPVDPSFANPLSTPASSYPSALSLSTGVTLAHKAFISAASESLLVAMLSNRTEGLPATRLGDSIVFLSPATRPLGMTGRNELRDAVKASFRLTLQRTAVFVQTIVHDTALRSISSSMAPIPLLDSPLVLAPFGTSATFVKSYSSSTFPSMVEGWQGALEGTGIELEGDTRWIVCRIALPSSTEESMEVIWPASLCLLDGSRPLPQSSPESSSPLLLPAGLALPAGPTTPLRLPSDDTFFRTRFASMLFRQPQGPSTTYHDPISSRAVKVGQMLEEMAEEQASRAREKEGEAAAAARASAPEVVTEVKTHPLPIAMVAASINMRTPISLGGTSTEAPSPADGFVPNDKTTVGLFANMVVDVVPRGPEHDHPYPSPPGAQASTHSDPATEDNFRPLPPIEATFADFDWGEDFGQGIHASLPQDFDDGMMMGLTDDDFSFFDDPAPLPHAAPLNFGGLQSSGPSPKFVDHFSHLTGTTPFNSVPSPTSPFGQSSPNLHHSPGRSFAYDPPSLGSNVLGLGGTPSTNHADGSPFKTPRTPYSPFIELHDDESEHASPAVDLPSSALSIAGTPAASLAPRSQRLSLFQALRFGNSHTVSDSKYDPRRGKFGLPSPEADSNDFAPLPVVGKSLWEKGWYTTVCDPRVVVAGALKRKRKGGKKEGKKEGKGWVTRGDEDSEGGEEGESEEEWMEVVSSGKRSEGDEIDHLAALGIEYPSGVSLVLLRGHLSRVLEKVEPVVEVAPVVVTRVTQSADAALEATAALLVDQFSHNPDFKASISSALLSTHTTPPSSVPTRAIQLVSSQVTALLSKSTSDISSPTLSLTSHRQTNILLRAQQAIMQLSTSSVKFWRPMAFEPLTGPKDTLALVIYEDGGAELSQSVRQWLDTVSNTYQHSRLGKHVAVTSGTTVEQGLAVIPVGTLSRSIARDDLKLVCGTITEASRSSKHVVVYLVTPPGAHPTTPSSPLALALQQLQRCRSGTTSLVIYPLPLSNILDLRPSTSDKFERLVFSVYDQLLVPVAQIHAPIPETFPSGNNMPIGPNIHLFQSPAITLSPARQTKIQFELQWPPSSLEVLHRHRLLHIAYICTPVRGVPGVEWIVMTCIDEKGEMWKTGQKLARVSSGQSVTLMRSKVVWNLARVMSAKADVEWRVVICKVGGISQEEIAAWDMLLADQLSLSGRPLHVSLVCTDFAPPISVLLLPSSDVSSPLPTAHRFSVEEGELSLASQVSKPAHLDVEPSFIAFTPPEPVLIHSDSDIIAPSSTFLVHIPRIASLSHTASSPLRSLASASTPNSSLSILGIHFLLSYATKSSSLDITLGELMSDVRQSWVELAALGTMRWGSSGRLPWHVEMVVEVAELLKEVEA